MAVRIAALLALPLSILPSVGCAGSGGDQADRADRGDLGSGSITELAGLSTPVRSVPVRLMHGGRPIEAAHIRAIPLDSNSVPLPVSIDLLVEYKYGAACAASTDKDGRATLDLYERLPYLVEVIPSPFSPLETEGPLAWTIEAGSDEFQPIPGRQGSGTIELKRNEQGAR